MFGCELCETYGQGDGELFAEYRYGEVKIGDKIFTPPTWSCLVCHDTKIASRQIWDEALEDAGCSDGGDHNMPLVKVACFKCCPDQSDQEFAIAEKEYYQSKQ
jgi:hypothetical protein